MLSNNSIVVQNWYSSSSYSEFSLTAGINISGVSYYGPLYISTVNNNQGHNPSGQFVYAINSYSRSEDVATINITYTGSQPNFARGSLYAVTGLPDPLMNATGMILNATLNSSNVFTLNFVNPGPDESQQSTSLGAINCPEPAWTTGFFFTPSSTNAWEVQQAVISSQFEVSYQQRGPQGLWNNKNAWTINFDNRSSKESRAIMAFVQNLQGVYSTTLMITDTTLYNNPSLKYLLTTPKLNTTSYNLNVTQVVATQVYEF